MSESAKDRILQLLKNAGSHGATTWMLIDETRHSAAARRVWDLQQEGHRIRKVNEGDGVYRWIYDGPPLPKPNPQKQVDMFELLDAIREVP